MNGRSGAAIATLWTILGLSMVPAVAVAQDSASTPKDTTRAAAPDTTLPPAVAACRALKSTVLQIIGDSVATFRRQGKLQAIVDTAQATGNVDLTFVAADPRVQELVPKIGPSCNPTPDLGALMRLVQPELKAASTPKAGVNNPNSPTPKP
jgi:hypothetical protein